MTDAPALRAPAAHVPREDTPACIVPPAGVNASWGRYGPFLRVPILPAPLPPFNGGKGLVGRVGYRMGLCLSHGIMLCPRARAGRRGRRHRQGPAPVPANSYGRRAR